MRRNFTLVQPRKFSRWHQLISLLLIGSGAFTLLARPTLVEMVRRAELDSFYVLLGPALFAFFLLLFAASAIFSEKKSRRPLSVAATFFGALLLAVIVPESLREYNARQAPEVASYEFFKDFLNSRDARVRALLVVSAACTTKSPEQWSEIIEKGLKDTDPLVREAAKYAVSDKTGHALASGDAGLESAKNLLEIWKSGDLVAHKSIP